MIVLDCDNTLWGGIVGEEGADGVSIGDGFPGNAFVAFQLELRRLSNRGVLLAICSKNNPDDVHEVFATRREMVLRDDDIAAWRVNWEPKSDNIAAHRRELNLGLDSFVFIDDSDFELAEVAAAPPEIRCLKVPDDPDDLPGLLATSGLVRSMLVSDEDRNRTAMIQQEGRRDAARRRGVARGLPRFTRPASPLLHRRQRARVPGDPADQQDQPVQPDDAAAHRG